MFLLIQKIIISFSLIASILSSTVGFSFSDSGIIFSGETSSKSGLSFLMSVNFNLSSSIVKKKSIAYADFLSNKMLMILVIREGVPYSLINLIQDFTPFSEESCTNILDISTKTLDRYKQTGKRFKSIQSEKIIEMAEVTYLGLDVFGSMDKFKLWLV